MKKSTLVNAASGVGLIVLVFSALFAGCFTTIFSILLKKMLVIAPDGAMYEKWQASPVPIIMKYYLFNVTNPEEVHYDGDTPIVNEMGPYTYIKRDTRENIEFEDDGNSVSYDAVSRFFFDRENSIGDETDLITTLNPILVVLGNKLNNLNSVFATLGSFVFYQYDMDELFITKSVGELLYKGYHDPLVQFMGEMTGNDKLKEGYFGYFYKKNGTSEGRWKVKTGKAGMEEYQHAITYDGEEKVDFWKTDYCNMINGTSGKQFPPGISRADSIRFYVPSFCRSMHTVYEADSEVNGLPTYKFVVHEEFYHVEPNNTCFCVDDFTCRDTFIDLTPCKGAPIILSLPHFLRGNKADQENVIGLNPNKEKHETYLDIEPVTGVIAGAAKRIQMSLPMKNYDFSAFLDVPEVIMPILWAEESAEMPKETAMKLLKITHTSFIVVYCVCGVLVALSIIVIIIATCQRRSLPKDRRGEYQLQQKANSTNGFHKK